MATRKFCKLHKSPADSFCLYHRVVCCPGCHKKFSGECVISDGDVATTKLKSEVKQSLSHLNKVVSDAAGNREMITQRLSETDEVKRCLHEEVTEFYSKVREIIDRQEEITRSRLNKTIAERSEDINDLNEQIDQITETTDALEKDAAEFGLEPAVGTPSAESDIKSDPEKLARHLLQVTEFITTADEIVSTGPTLMAEPFALEFRGGNDSLLKFERILKESSEIETMKHEGAVTVAHPLDIQCASNDRCRNAEDETASLDSESSDDERQSGMDNEGAIDSKPKWLDITDKIKGRIEAVKYGDCFKKSDIIVVTRDPACLLKMSDEGNLKSSVSITDLGYIPDFCAKGGIVYVPSYHLKAIVTFRLDDLSLIETIPANGNCRSVDILANGIFVVGYSNPPAVKLLTKDGVVLSESQSEFSNCLFIAVATTAERILVVDFWKNSVFVLAADLSVARIEAGLPGPRSPSPFLDGSWIVPCRDGDKVMLLDQHQCSRGIAIEATFKVWCVSCNVDSRKIIAVMGQEYQCMVCSRAG